MRHKVVTAECPSTYVAMRQDGEEQFRRLLAQMSVPDVCPKCGYYMCIRHEEGVQCLNCFKIIYLGRRT